MTVAASAFGMLQSPFATLHWVNIFLAAFIIFNLVYFFSQQNEKEIIPTFKWSFVCCCFFMVVVPAAYSGHQHFFYHCCVAGKANKISAGNWF